jgi:hypothetical protein
VNHETHERTRRTRKVFEPFVPFRAFVFQTAIHKFERSRAQQREAERQAGHLFQTLLHRAFRGALRITKLRKGHEGRERFSCISCPFALFVFRTAIHQFARLRAQQREAQRQAEHLFQTRLMRCIERRLSAPE